jgi:hypothetical protein
MPGESRQEIAPGALLFGIATLFLAQCLHRLNRCGRQYGSYGSEDSRQEDDACTSRQHLGISHIPMGPGCERPAQRQTNKDADRSSNEYRHDTTARNLFHDVRSRRPEGNTHSKFPPALSDEVGLNTVEPGYRENQREDREAKEEV